MKHFVSGLLILAACAGRSFAAAPPTMPFSDVRAGMRGTARTVFEGTRVETIEVEVLGKIPNIGPRQNLILARCSGGPLAHTGILSGMSGSPVTIDGKLVGAIAYSWGFSSDAIAGITPIEEMLELRRLRSPAAERAADFRLDRGWRRALFDATALGDAWTEQLQRLGAAPRGTWKQPLGIGGFGAGGVARIRTRLDAAGIPSVQASASGATAEVAPPLEAGSAIGVKLVRGDVEVSATGTATWVEGDELLAFGHPLFGLGPLDVPLTAARVEALLPSLHQSSRVAVPLAEVGALREDRTAGIYGRLGGRPQMIPVRVQLDGGAPNRSFSFDVADDPLLAPVLLYLSLVGILDSAERTAGQVTLRLASGSVIKLEDGRDVQLDNVFAGTQAATFATGLPAYVLHLLMNNAWSPPRIVGVNILLEYAEQPRTVRLVRAVADRYRVTPGETVELEITLEPFRGPRRRLRASVRVPDGQPPGSWTLLVAGPAIVQRDEMAEEPVLPRDLDQLVGLINRLRRNDRVYIVAREPDTGWIIDGTRLANLPPSVAAVLGRPGGRGSRLTLPFRHAVEESLAAGDVVEGSVRIELEVLPR
ncbi:MAG: hypothetical protein HKP30_04575 [Myxococcales bacterium]|nr:hypothetical protein [Myxococcales bacterium]